jgi:hypothetical protein
MDTTPKTTSRDAIDLLFTEGRAGNTFRVMDLLPFGESDMALLIKPGPGAKLSPLGASFDLNLGDQYDLVLALIPHILNSFTPSGKRHAIGRIRKLLDEVE